MGRALHWPDSSRSTTLQPRIRRGGLRCSVSSGRPFGCVPRQHRLIELHLGVYGWFVPSETSWRLAHAPSAGPAQPGFRTRSQRQGVAVLWLERGGRAERSAIRHAHLGPCPSQREGAVVALSVTRLTEAVAVAGDAVVVRSREIPAHRPGRTCRSTLQVWRAAMVTSSAIASANSSSSGSPVRSSRSQIGPTTASMIRVGLIVAGVRRGPRHAR